LSTIAALMHSQLNLNQTNTISTPNLEVKYSKVSGSSLNGVSLNLNSAGIIMPANICQLINITNCENQELTTHQTFYRVAVNGINGANETNTNKSSSIGFSIHSGSNGTEIKVNSTNTTLSFWIPLNFDDEIEFEQVNASVAAGDYFTYRSFQLSGSNISVQIQIEPYDLSIGYLAFIKLGKMPNISNNEFDVAQVFCPCGKQDLNLNSFFIKLECVQVCI
jgi:hypothetical protein